MLAPPEGRTIIRTSVSLTPEQYDWLKRHEEFNLSGFVRRVLDDYIEKHDNN